MSDYRYPGQPVTDGQAEPDGPAADETPAAEPEKAPVGKRERIGQCSKCKAAIFKGDSHQEIRSQGLRCVKCEIKT